MGVGEICNVVIVLVNLCRYIQTCANAAMFLYVVRTVRISDQKRTHCKANRSRFSNISYQDAIGYKLANPCLLFWSVTTCHDAQQPTVLSAHCKDVELIRSSLLHTGLVEHAKTSTAQWIEHSEHKIKSTISRRTYAMSFAVLYNA